MKKLFKTLIITILMLLPITLVEAAGSITVSPSSLSIAPGKSKTITIKASNAAGRVDVVSSNTAVATVSQSSLWVENGSASVTIKGISEGTSTISVKITDAATFDGEVLSGTKNVAVSVKENKVTENTTDATLKTLAITGATIDFKKDVTSYSIEVNNDINKLNIVATPSISTAKVKIEGTDDLQLGKNTVKITVTSKGGNTKEYTIEVTRKDNIPEATLENISETINNTTKDTIAINIENNKILSNELITQLKNSKKNIIINKYDANNNLIYAWSISNEKINLLKDFDLSVSFEADNKEALESTANYAEMITLNFKDENNIPKSTKIKVFVGNKYTNDTILKSYSYDKGNKSFKLVNNELKVKDGYVELEVKETKDFILTRSDLTNQKEGINVFAIITAIETVGIIGLASYTFIPKNKKKKAIKK